MEPRERTAGEFDAESDGGVLGSRIAFAVLGLVIEKPSYGYEIYRRFESRFGGFFSISLSSIYSALKRLAAAGLIEEMAGMTSVGAPRGAKAGSSYCATGQGARTYRRRVAERLRSDPERAEMLGRLVLAGIDGIKAALELLDRYEEQCLLELQEMDLPGASWSASTEVSRLVERLVFEGRRRTIDAQLQWVDYARAELLALAEQELIVDDDLRGEIAR